MRSKHSSILFLFVFLFLFFIVPDANAQGIIYGDSIPAGQTVDNDLILFGDTVTIQGTIEGDVLAIGRLVGISGQVEGSVFVISQFTDIEGLVRDSLYSMALELRTGEKSSIGRSLYFLGLSLIVDQGSQIGRDLVAGTLGAQIVGEVGRGVRAVIGPLELIRLLMEAIGQPFELREVLEPESSMDLAEFHQSTDRAAVYTASRFKPELILLNDLGHTVVITSQELSSLDKLADPMQDQTNPTAIDIQPEDIWDWVQGRFRALVTLLIIGLLMLWLRPSAYTAGALKLQTKPWISLGLGFIGLVLAVNILAVAGLLSVIVLLIGIWLGIVTFWELAFLFWGIGFSSILLATTLFIAFAFYGTKAIVSYWVGALILKPAGEPALRYKALPLFLGLFLFVILSSIPILGWVLTVFIISLGLGATYLALRDEERIEKEVDEGEKK